MMVNRIYRSEKISDCGLYRWSLRRSWSRHNTLGFDEPCNNGVCCFVMLNPSTADGLQDDPTIRRCIGFAQAWGYSSLSVRNLFPFRATNPKELLKNPDIVTGGERGESELLAAMTADIVVAAWGANVPFNRDNYAMKLFDRFPAKPIHCLELTKLGKPRHPLYVTADKTPIVFRGPRY